MSDKWVIQLLNPKLVLSFFKELVSDYKDLSFELYYDPQIGSNKIILKESFLDILKEKLNSRYFIVRKFKDHLHVTSNQVDIDEFLKYRKSLNNKTISVGDVVKLNLDGLLYVVESIDQAKSKVVISRANKNNIGVSIRVNLSSVIPTLRE